MSGERGSKMQGDRGQPGAQVGARARARREGTGAVRAGGVLGASFHSHSGTSSSDPPETRQ